MSTLKDLTSTTMEIGGEGSEGSVPPSVEITHELAATYVAQLAEIEAKKPELIRKLQTDRATAKQEAKDAIARIKSEAEAREAQLCASLRGLGWRRPRTIKPKPEPAKPPKNARVRNRKKSTAVKPLPERSPAGEV